jgi:hypothetical protein
MQETGKSDAGNDKKQVRWRIASPEEAQTQGERLRYYRDTVHPRRRRNTSAPNGAFTLVAIGRNG